MQVKVNFVDLAGGGYALDGDIYREVEEAGMTVIPGDMVHMDLHGVVKFPAAKMEEVLERATKLLESESSIIKIYKDSGFTLKKWKHSVEGTKSQ
jgi:regulator of RNase E activity RraA